MALDESQRATLAAAIRADTDPGVVAALAIRNDTELTRLYNLPGDFVVWRSSVLAAEYRTAVTWTEVDALTAGKARIWEWVTSGMTLPLDPSDATVRQGLADCWGPLTATRAALLAVAKRAASKAERLYTTGTGETGTPGTMGWEGPLSLSDVSDALNANP